MASGMDCKLDDIFGKITEVLEKNNEVIEGAFTMMTQLSHYLRDNMNAGDSGKSKKDKNAAINDATRPDQVTVEVKVTFLKIMDIDTILENYAAEVFLYARWEEPFFDGMTEEQRVKFDKKTNWEPQISILNLQQELEGSKKRYSIKLSEPGYEHPVVVMAWRFKAIFKERLELRHFPCDVQDLTLTVSSERTLEEVVLVADHHCLSAVNVDAFQDASEWCIYEHVECSQASTAADQSSASNAMLHVSCRVKRRMGYFLWNIVLIMLLIVMLSFSLSVIDPGRTDRMALSLTLFLTAIAFKLACTSSLPTISYLTYLDTYVLLSLFFLGGMIGWNASIFALAEGGMAKYRSVDKAMLGFLGGVVFFFHVGFGWYIYLTAFQRRREMKMKDEAYQRQKIYLNQYGVVMPMDEFILKENP